MGSDRRIPAAECTEYPWWVIIDPNAIHGLFGKDQRAGRVASAVTGPFLSREAATAQLERRRYAYSANAVVWCMTGHDSADWRALCHEDPVERGVLRARAEAAERRAEALAAELAQARADARVLLAECYSADVADGGDFFGSAGMLAQAGMTRSEMAQVRMLPVSGDDPAGLLAVIRRALGGAA